MFVLLDLMGPLAKKTKTKPTLSVEMLAWFISELFYLTGTRSERKELHETRHQSERSESKH